jgi:hypothetical protein
VNTFCKKFTTEADYENKHRESINELADMRVETSVADCISIDWHARGPYELRSARRGILRMPTTEIGTALWEKANIKNERNQQSK